MHTPYLQWLSRAGCAIVAMCRTDDGGPQSTVCNIIQSTHSFARSNTLNVIAQPLLRWVDAAQSSWKRDFPTARGWLCGSVTHSVRQNWINSRNTISRVYLHEYDSPSGKSINNMLQYLFCIIKYAQRTEASFTCFARARAFKWRLWSRYSSDNGSRTARACYV